MVNSNKWVYTADLEVKLNVKIKGSSKDKKSKALEILKNPKTYDMMLYPTEFNSKNIKVNVNKSCTMITLSIKDAKLLFFTGASIPKTNAEILANLNKNLNTSLSDGWGESGIVFGEPRWEYSDSKRTPVNSKNISKITPHWETYYIDWNYINLPPNTDPTKEYGYPENWCKKINVYNPDRPNYYYKNLQLQYSPKDDVYKVYEMPKLFNKLKKDFEKTKSGTFILPKKFESKVEKYTQYLSCQVPSKYAGKIYLRKNDLPKEVPLKFFRLDKHPKNYPSYFVGNKLVYKTEPDWIWWDSGKIINVENIRKR
jgi:hypothetical protein